MLPFPPASKQVIILKITYRGEELEAEGLEIVKTLEEGWAIYLARDKDGKLWDVRVRTILIAVRKIIGRTAPDGTPAFQVPNNCVISVEPHED